MSKFSDLKYDLQNLASEIEDIEDVESVTIKHIYSKKITKCYKSWFF